MAKRRGGGVKRYGKFTPARRQALKRAAYISAQKRHARRKRNIRVGVIATGVIGAGAAIYAGHKTGVNKQVADSVKNFKPKAAVNSARNRLATALLVSSSHKEAVRKAGAISPPRIVRAPKNKIEVPQVDPQTVRDKDTPYRPPGSHQRYTDGGDLIDKTDKYLPRELVKGRKIKDTTIQKALNKSAQAKGASGVKGGQSRHTTLAGQNEIVNRMIADGSVRRTVAGRQIAKGVTPEVARANAAKRRKVVRERRKKAALANPAKAWDRLRKFGVGGMTEDEIKIALGFDS